MQGNQYRPPPFFGNGHTQTIFPTLFRTIPEVKYRRERLDTPDGDFLDLDWSRVGSRHLAILSHGLEGHTDRAYMRGMVRALNRAHIDALAWNYRGCSEELNRLLRMYHNGTFDDLHHVVHHAAAAGNYQTVFLIGFSMGGNMTMLYLGKQAEEVPSWVKAAVGFSVPCDLTDASRQLDRRANAIYMQRFLKSLHLKIKAKQARFPTALDDTDYYKIKTFRQFDDRYTAPIHGFADAADYWRRCSCKQWLTKIKMPVLLVNALDDPILADGCYPVDECRQNPHVILETPRYGGHVGFVAFNSKGCYWSEERALKFIRHSDSRSDIHNIFSSLSGSYLSKRSATARR